MLLKALEQSGRSTLMVISVDCISCSFRVLEGVTRHNEDQ
jgi:hypothetical protein